MGSSLPRNPDARRLLQLAEQAGWPYEMTGGHHWKVTPPYPAQPIIFGSTPSDHHGIKETEAAFKRAGVHLAIEARKRKSRRGTGKRLTAQEARDALPANLRLNLEEFGTRVSIERVARALTQKEFGAEAGLSAAHISRIENGMPAGMDALYAVMKACGWQDLEGTPISENGNGHHEPDPEPVAEEPEPPKPEPKPWGPLPDVTAEDRKLAPYVRALGALSDLMEDHHRTVAERDEWRRRALAAEARLEQYERAEAGAPA